MYISSLLFTFSGIVTYSEKWGRDMIEVTKINDVKILVNPDLIEIVEETPDTVVTLTTGKKNYYKRK